MTRTERSYEVFKKDDGVPVKLWTRGVPVEDAAIAQLENISRLPFVHSHVAVMPDVHLGKGATVGSVIPTEGAIVPAAVGVDLGCGMMAVRTSVTASDLPDNLRAIRTAIEAAVPHGRTNNGRSGDRGAWGDAPKPVTDAHVPEQRTHRPVAAEGRAVDLDQRARHEPTLLLQLVEPPGEPRLAGPRGPRQEDRRRRGRADLLEAAHHVVEGRVERLDALLEEGEGVAGGLGLAGGHAVVTRQVEVDDAVEAAGAQLGVVAPGSGRGLEQLGREVAGLGQQEEADLRDVGAGGDVHEVPLALGVEGVVPGEGVERVPDLLEVPGIGDVHHVAPDVGPGRGGGDVVRDPRGEAVEALVVEQLDPGDRQVRLLREGHGGSPGAPPALAAAPAIELGAQQAEDDDGALVGGGGQLAAA